MPASTSFERIGRSDFFAIMAAGFYIFISIFLLASGLMQGIDDSSVWRRIINPWDQTALLWFLAFAAIFLSYAFGSLVRAISVDTADRWSYRIRSWLRRKSKARPWQPFPYAQSLSELLETLREDESIRQMEIVLPIEMRKKDSDSATLMEGREAPPEKRASRIFGYWKMFLCERSPEAFAVAVEAEARSRFFAGMFWAGVVSCSIGLFGLCWFWLHKSQREWCSVYAVLTVLSIIFIVVFGHQLRRVRVQEAWNVFIAYVAIHDKRGNPHRE